MTRLLREQRDTAIQMAAGAEARTEELEARWQALKDWLAGQAKPPEYVAEPADIAGHGYRLALAKMAELEEGK